MGSNAAFHLYLHFRIYEVLVGIFNWKVGILTWEYGGFDTIPTSEFNMAVPFIN